MMHASTHQRPLYNTSAYPDPIGTSPSFSTRSLPGPDVMMKRDSDSRTQLFVGNVSIFWSVYSISQAHFELVAFSHTVARPERFISQVRNRFACRRCPIPR